MRMKRDPYVILLAIVIVVAMSVALYKHLVGWSEYLIGLGLMQVPSLFERRSRLNKRLSSLKSSSLDSASLGTCSSSSTPSDT